MSAVSKARVWEAACPILTVEDAVVCGGALLTLW